MSSLDRRRRRMLLTLRTGVAPTYSPEANALFARFTTPPTDSRKVLINNLIVALLTAGVWQKLDCFYMLAAADSQAARQNWIANQYNPTPVSGPTFTVDRGYTGDGSASYLQTGFNPATAGGLFGLNAAHIGAWDLTSRAAANTALMGSRVGTTLTDLGPRGIGDLLLNRVNAPSGTLPASVESAGYFVANRSGASATEAYRDGSSVATASSAAVAVPSVGIGLLARTREAGVTDSYTTDQLAAAHIGASLSGADVLAIYNATRTYLQAVGAVP